MNDRAGFLAKIRRQPLDYTARMVYADWLDEFGTTDFDRATSEFLRISCRVVKSEFAAMPKAAYPWLASNWKRLVPSFWSECEQRGATGWCHKSHAGARFEVTGHLVPVCFEFTIRRGFLVNCTAHAPTELVPLVLDLWQRIATDQPLTKPRYPSGHRSVSVVEAGLRVYRELPLVRLPAIRL